MDLILVYISGLAFSMVSAMSNDDSKYASGVRHFMGLYKPPKTSSFSLNLSSWELNLINEMLMDIAMAKCSNIYPEELDDIKSYVSEQIAAAPVSAAMNSGFLEVYTNLLQCSEITQGPYQRVEVVEDKKQSDLNAKTKNKDIESTSPQLVLDPETIDTINAYNKLQSFKAEVIPVGTESLEISKAINDIHLPTTDDTDEKLQSPIATKLSTVLEKKKPDGNGDTLKASSNVQNQDISKTELEKESEEDLGLIDSVGHVFKKLYENTVNIFSWFGRRKREVSYKDDTISKLKSSLINKQRLYTQIKPSKSKHHHKKVHRKMKKVSSNIRSAREHFVEVFNSLDTIVLRSCPEEVQPVNYFIQEAIKEMLWYVNTDLEKVASERKKLTLDVGLQQRVKSCSNSIQI